MAPSVAEPPAPGRLTDQDWQVSNATTTLPERAILTDAPPERRTFSVPLDAGEFVVEVFGDPPGWIEPTIRSLGDLLRLPPDWDSYGGAPVDPRCVAAALNFALETLGDQTPAPAVVPTSRGGIQFEWHTRGIDMEIEFVSPTRIYSLFEDSATGTSWERDVSSDLHPLTAAISKLSPRR